MEDEKIEDINKDESQQQNMINTEKNQNKSNYLSIMNEEQTSLWITKLNLNEEVLKELENIIKNGKDLIAVYNNNKILEKLNIDLHSINILNNAIEEGLEEQLKINILLEKEKNIVLNIENEPKYKLKDLINYLEKLLKRAVYLTPVNSPNEILTPNTLIMKKILLNPLKYCNLKLFDEKTIIANKNNTFGDSNNLPSTKLDNNNIDINKNKKEIPIVNENDNNTDNLNNINNINLNNNNLNLINTNTNNQKLNNLSKGYISLFQNKKNNLPDFTTDYKMPSQNKSNGNNFIKLETKNITPSKPIEDFKYHNLLSKKEKDDKDDINNISNNMKFLNENNINDAKNLGFKNITNFKNIDPQDNEANNMNINKNYLTQRNFNSKTISNDNNNVMFQQIFNKKRSDKNISDIMGRKTIDNLEEDNTNTNTNSNLSFLERNKREKEKDNFNINFINKDNNNDMKKVNNKTENRYEFARLQDFDKNIFNFPKASNPENNDINNLIINNQKEELHNSKEKFSYGGNNNNLKEESETDILKVLREKYSLQGNDIKEPDNNNNNRINIDFKKDYKPKTPINEIRRNINNDNMRFNNISDDNSNNPLENKFLMKQNDEFKFNNNFLNRNNQQMFKMQQEDDDDNNIMSKFKIDMKMENNINNINNNKIGKNKMNRPSSGLEFNSFQYKAAGYKSSFPQNQDNDFNQYNNQDDD